MVAASIYIPDDKSIADCAKRAASENGAFSWLTDEDQAVVLQQAQMISNEIASAAAVLRQQLREKASRTDGAQVEAAVRDYNELRRIYRTHLEASTLRMRPGKRDDKYVGNPLVVYKRMRIAKLEGDISWLTHCTSPFFRDRDQKVFLEEGQARVITLHPVNLSAPGKDDAYDCMEMTIRNQHPNARILPADQDVLLAAAKPVSVQIAEAAAELAQKLDEASRKNDVNAANVAIDDYSKRAKSALNSLKDVEWVPWEEVFTGPCPQGQEGGCKRSS